MASPTDISTIAGDPDLSTDAGAIIHAVQRLHGISTVDLGSGKAAVAIPRGLVLHSIKPLIDEYRTAPERIRGTADLETLESFIAHAMRFTGPHSVVFAKASGLTAVYDYLGNGQPAFCEHRATYSFPYSAEWQAWRQAHERQLPQLAFAEFLEAHIADVTTPKADDAEHFGELGFTLATPAQLLALSRSLTVRVESTAVAKANLSTGEMEVAFKEEHTDTAGAAMKVPAGFMLLIPPHEGGALYRIPVRLRYRVVGGKVNWTMLLHRLDAVLRDALKHACTEVITRTGLPLFYGSAEDIDAD